MLRRLFPQVYEGWLVVAASAFAVLIIGAPFFFGFGTIFNEVIDEFGWSVAATALAFSLRQEVGGIAAPFVGVMIDRVGPRRVMILGMVIAALSVLLLSLIQNLWQFYAVMILIAIGTSTAGGQVGLAAVATWFEVRRARAMSFMTVGGGVGGLLVVVIAAMVEEFGWRLALRLLSVFMLTAGIAVGVMIRGRPEDHPQPMDGIAEVEVLGAPPRYTRRWGVPVRRVVRTKSFIFLSLGMVALSFGTTALIVHQIPYLEREIGVSKSVAGLTVAVFTLTSIIGRLGMGFLADRYSKRVIVAGSTALVALGLPLLAVADSLGVAIVAIVIIAPGFGGSIPVRPAMLADYYGTLAFGTINGIASLIMTTGGAIGPWVVGWIVDVTGHYDAGWYLSAGVTAVSIPLFLAAAPPRALIEEYRDAPRAVAPVAEA